MFRKLSSTKLQETGFSIFIDNVPVLAQTGETIAAVLLRQDSPIARTTPVKNNPRAPYCMMGVCFECLAIVDGAASVQTCLTLVEPGMRIERQHGRWPVAHAVPGDSVMTETGTWNPLNEAK
jgi:hypothetical protein